MKADYNFVCTLWSNDGMGRVGEELLLAFDKLGVKINVIPHIYFEEGLKERTKELVKIKYEPSEKTIFYTIPELFEKYHTKFNYVHIPWDTTIPPQTWIDNINKYATKVYPCSDFVKEVFANNGITVPMTTIKHGVNTEDYPYLKREWDRQFTFLTFGNISMRKGTDVLIRAFQKAFPTETNVELIIKSNKTMAWGNIHPPIDVRIKTIEEPYSHKQMLDLMEKSHVYVAPSRSEGFCLPAIESMSTGMGLILHNWGGISMMVNDKYNFVLESSGQIPAQTDIYPEDYKREKGIGNWGEPNEEKLVGLMRYCYERREEVKEKGKLASQWTRDAWEWKFPAKALLADIEKGTNISWGKFYRNDTLTKNNVQDSINSHKELFWLIRGFKADKIIEAGTGTGEMAGFLTWDKQEVQGKEPTKHHPKEVIAIDNDRDVLELARINLKSIDGTARLEFGDVFSYPETADLIFSQGLVEHMTDEEMRALVDFELTKAPILVHSVPNSDYGKLDYGNERLLRDEDYKKIFDGYNMTIYKYWDEDGVKKQTILVFKEKTNIDVSIIMTVFNQKEMTINAINAIRENTENYELIVLDNGSTDGISEWLDEQEDVRTVHLDKNYGIPKPKNLGMALSRGKYICFVDNDTLAGKNWLFSCLKTLESDSKVGFSAHEGYMVAKDRKSFNGEKVLSGKIDWASHSVFIFRPNIVGELVDTDQWCLEDVDMCYRFKEKGYYGVIPEEKVNIVHFGSATAKNEDYFKDHARHFEITNELWKKWETII
jgi:glycosyltransferase involved in cell wall biosynthesis/SAM-dependent methyltransferase